MVKEGIYKNTELSNEDYHSDNAIGSTGIKDFAECPALFYARHIDPNRPEKKDSSFTRIGSAAHVTLLEPDIFNDKYAVLEDDSVTKKSVKAFLEFKKQNEKKECLLLSEYKKLLDMCNAIKRHEMADFILSKGVKESSFFAKCPNTDIMLKSRPDVLSVLNDKLYIADYKTTSISLNAKKQSDHAFSLKRQIQGYHHKNVVDIALKKANKDMKVEGIIYIVQSTDYPYLIRLFRLTEEHLSIGKDQCEMNISEIANCIKNEEWPEYEQNIIDYEMPAWAQYEYN